MAKESFERLGLLFSLFLLFSGIYGGIIKLLFTMNTSEYIPSAGLEVIIRGGSIFFSYYIFKYLLFILYSLALETEYLATKKKVLDKKRNVIFNKCIVEWKHVLYYSFISLMTSITTIIYGPWIGLIYGAILVVLLPIYSLFYFDDSQLKFPDKRKIDRIIHSIRSFYQKVLNLKVILGAILIRIKQINFFQILGQFIKEIGTIFLPVFFIIIYLIIFISTFSHVNIEFDKSYYHQGENVEVIITPAGAVPPIIDKIFYHDIELYNQSMDSNFLRSPRTVVVPGDKLKLQPYNSHINVVYRFFPKELFFLNTIGDNAIKYVPVFPNENISQTHELSFIPIKDDFIPSNISNNLVIRNQTEWKLLWQDMESHTYSSNGTEFHYTAPDIDFPIEMVILVSTGAQSSGAYAIEITKVIETKDKIEVYVHETIPKEDEPVMAAITWPYSMVKVKYSDKPVVFIQ